MLLVAPLSKYGIAQRALNAEKLESGSPHLFRLVTHAGEWHSLSWLPAATMYGTREPIGCSQFMNPL